MGNIRSYRDLLVWQKGMALVTEVYATTKKYPAFRTIRSNEPNAAECGIGSE